MLLFSSFSLSSGSKNSKWSCSHWNSYKWLVSIEKLPWRKKKIPWLVPHSQSWGFDFSDRGFFFFFLLPCVSQSICLSCYNNWWIGAFSMGQNWKDFVKILVWIPHVLQLDTYKLENVFWGCFGFVCICRVIISFSALNLCLLQFELAFWFSLLLPLPPVIVLFLCPTEALMTFSLTTESNFFCSRLSSSLEESLQCWMFWQLYLVATPNVRRIFAVLQLDFRHIHSWRLWGFYSSVKPQYMV